MTAPIHVVAGVLQDAAGRILLTRRTAERDLAGLWEFPGGKCEPGETPERALRRELQEELGIDIGAVAPLISAPQAYPDKRIVLDVYRVAGFRGQPRGLEDQALLWVPPSELTDYPMPPADVPVVAALLAPDCYAITPADGDDAALLPWADQVLASGVRRLQLRRPGSSPAQRESLARQLLARCRATAAELLINGDAELAARLQTGLHLPAAQLLRLRERPWVAGPSVAASCHGLEELRYAQALQLDFVVLGPVAATASHPDATLLGWPGFCALREQVALPIYALGGLSRDDQVQARQCGAQGIAAIRAFAPAS